MTISREVPSYQRLYSWTTGQAEELIADLLDVRQINAGTGWFGFTARQYRDARFDGLPRGSVEAAFAAVRTSDHRGNDRPDSEGE